MRLIDADVLTDELENDRPLNWTDSPGEIQEQNDWDIFIGMVSVANTIDAVPVEVVAQMFFDWTGDLCPCNYNDIDEWLPESCELLNDCPNPKGDRLACWKQYIKHWQPRKEADGK